MRGIASIAAVVRATRSFPVILLITAAIGVLGILLARRVANGWTDQDLGNLSDGAASTPSQIASLLSGDAQAEVGDMVFLNDVRVTPGPKAQVFVVSGAQGKRMLLLSEAGTEPAVRSETTVDIKGRIRRLPSSAVLRKGWKLNGDEVRTFSEQGVYIAAESMKETKAGTN